MMQIPESMIGVGQPHMPNLFIKKTAVAGQASIDPDRIIETDFLRWLILMGESQPQFVEIAKQNIQPEYLKVSVSQKLFQVCIETFESGKQLDLLSLAIDLDDEDAQLLISEILEKKVNRDRATIHFPKSVQKILDRNWMEKREEIKMKIQNGQSSEDEALALAKEFGELNRTPPKVVV
jgi:DNA primase